MRGSGLGSESGLALALGSGALVINIEHSEHNIEEQMLGERTAVIGWLGYTQWVDKDEGRPPSG